MSRKEVLRVSHFSNSSGESLLIFCTTGSKVGGGASKAVTYSRFFKTYQPAQVGRTFLLGLEAPSSVAEHLHTQWRMVF